ncbi:helix-turn-helix domain-containing protein [Undibacterium sp. Di27W]|uniref:helix-turn-helix domain-containing protein n=1 Tax=Undibacterium sp. Di27W TaxID=3413036 RepID=UPI003BF326C4
MTTIADRIDIAMRIEGFKSQAELSRASGVPSSSLVRILKSESLPSIENLVAIAAACGRSIDWIVTGNEKTNFNSPEVSLSYVTTEELKLLTQFREATDMGKNLIRTAGDTAPKVSAFRGPNPNKS